MPALSAIDTQPKTTVFLAQQFFSIWFDDLPMYQTVYWRNEFRDSVLYILYAILYAVPSRVHFTFRGSPDKNLTTILHDTGKFT